MATKVFQRLVKASSFGMLTASLAAACGSPSEQEHTSQLQITNGFAIENDEFPAVVLLLIQGSASTRICTATFINDHQALTAAHCVAQLPNQSPPIFFAQPSNQPKQQAYQVKSQARRIHVHPLYDSLRQDEVHKYDLAIIDFPVATAPAAASLSSQRPNIDTAVTLVGFGEEERYLDENGVQSGLGAGVKRYGQNRIQSFENDMISFSGLPRPDEYFGIGQWVATGQGDSGGPLFFDGKLAGVTSGGRLERGRHGELIAFSHYVDLNLSENIDFLGQTLW